MDAVVVVIEVVEDEVDLENEKVSVASKIRERARKLNLTNRYHRQHNVIACSQLKET